MGLYSFDPTGINLTALANMCEPSFHMTALDSTTQLATRAKYKMCVHDNNVFFFFLFPEGGRKTFAHQFWNHNYSIQGLLLGSNQTATRAVGQGEVPRTSVKGYVGLSPTKKLPGCFERPPTPQMKLRAPPGCQYF